MKKRLILKTLRIFDAFNSCLVGSILSTAIIYFAICVMIVGQRFDIIAFSYVLILSYSFFLFAFFLLFVVGWGPERKEKMAKVKIEHLKKYKDSIAYRKNQIWFFNPIVMPFFPFIQLLKFIRASQK